MKTKITNIGLILIILLFNINLSVYLGAAGGSGTTAEGTIYSWGLKRYSSNLIQVWNNETFIIDRDCVSSSSSTSTRGYNSTEEPGMYIEETTIREATYNSTDFQNMTISGNMTISMNLDTYMVNITDSDSLQLIWMAVKNGSLLFDYYIDKMENEFAHTNDIKYNITKSYVKYNITTGELIYVSNWSDPSYSDQEYHSSSSDDFTAAISNDELYHYSMDLNFTMPMIMSMLIYTSQNDHKVAWADSFWDYLIYNDTNMDGIYTAGQKQVDGGNGINLYYSDELKGLMIPYALESTVSQVSINTTDYSTIYNATYKSSFPLDKVSQDFHPQIEFNSPTVGSNGKVSWNILYPEYPIFSFVDSYNNIDEPYEYLSPGNFSYGFDFSMNEGEANLDHTIELPRITNTSLYNAVQGYGLSIPHYTYFLSSSEINKKTDDSVSRPAGLFDFDIAGISVAKIDMLNPKKKNYTLYDYPIKGTDSSFESKGATVMSLIASINEINFNPQFGGAQPFTSVVFSLSEIDVVKNDPSFNNASHLYCIETQNYPTWSGEKLIHDPTITAYYKTSSRNGSGNETPPPFIDGYLLFPLVATSLITFSLITRKIHRKRKFE